MTGDMQWIVDRDISKFFDTLEPSHRRSFLQPRVREGVITRLISKWRNAGGREQGVWTYPEAGTPQGGAIAPVLSHSYLPDVLDPWFAQEVNPRLRGRACIVRFADDAGMGCAVQEDAEKVCRVLPKRFGKYALPIHPDKTRLVACGRPSGTPGKRPGTVDFVGFTPSWGQSRWGKWIVKSTTAPQRLRRGRKRIDQWCRRHRHQPVVEQHRELCRKIQGHYAYSSGHMN